MNPKRHYLSVALTVAADGERKNVLHYRHGLVPFRAIYVRQQPLKDA